MRAHRLFLAEVRVYPTRVVGAAFACAVTAAATGACGLLLVAIERSPSSAWAADTQSSMQDAESLFSLLISLMTMSAVTVLGTTISLWTTQRHHHFAVLRALGTTVGRVRGLVVADVLWLAAISAALGAAAGMGPLAWWGRRLLISRHLLPDTVALPGAATTGMVGTAVCVMTCVVAVLAGFSSIHAAGRVTAMAALRERTATRAVPRSRARLITGMAMLATLCVPLIVLIGSAGVPTMTRTALSTGLALVLIPTLAVLAPWVIPLLSRPFITTLRLMDPWVGKLAASGLRLAPARTSAIAVPVLLSIGISTCLLGTDANMNAAIRQQSAQALRAAGVVTAKDGIHLPASVPGAPASGATAVLATRVTTPPTSWNKHPKPQRTWGVDGPALGAALDLSVREGNLTALTDGSFAAGAAIVESQGWHLGQRVRLILADGRNQYLRLIAIYARDLAYPGLLLSQRTAVAHTPDIIADQYLLTSHDHAWPVAKGLQVRSRAEYLAQLQPRSAADSLATYLMVAVVVGYALLSAANTCALAQRDRTSERVHLRAIGLSRLQLTRLVALETLAATAVGALLAAMVAMVCLAPLAVHLGQGIVPALNWPWTAGVAGAAVLLTAGPALLAAHPARGIARQFDGASR